MTRVSHTGLVLLLAIAPGTAQAQTPGELTLEPFTFEGSGGIEFEAERGRLTVLEDRSDPGGRTISLAVMRFPSTADQPGPPIIYLAGGPGGSAVGAARGFFLPLFNRLREVADVVFMDQRGTGFSTPRLFCPAQEAPPGDLFASYDRMLGLYTESARKCADHWREQGVDIAAYNTEASADDIEDLRIALGVEQVSLLGFSYGTHLGLATTRRHGDHIERVVLVGTEGPAHNQKLPSTYDTQLEKLSMLAAKDPDIHEKVPSMTATLARLLGRLRAEPMVVTITDRRGVSVEVTVTDLALQYLIRRDVGDGNDFPIFPAWFYAMENGDDELLAWFVTKRYNEMSFGTSVMSVAMDCASGIPSLRAEQIAAETDGSLLGRMVNLGFPDVCEAVGDPDLGDDYRSPILSDVTTLFISGSLDSNTPPHQAEEVRWGFPNSAHLIVENAGHEDMIPHPDVQQAIMDFLGGQDVRDRSIALPQPDFIPIVPAPATAESVSSSFEPVGSYDFETVVNGQPTAGTVEISMTEDGRYGGIITRPDRSDVPLESVAVEDESLYLIADLGDEGKLKMQFKMEGDRFSGVWWTFNRVAGKVSGARRAR